MEIKELLPIGTIVLLEGGTHPLMIFGIKQMNSETEEEYDYIAVPYPEGNMGGESQFLFNHDAVVEVLYRGFEDASRDDFLEQLTDFYNNQQ